MAHNTLQLRHDQPAMRRRCRIRRCASLAGGGLSAARTVAFARGEASIQARCTCQCCPGLLSARPMGGRCLCCCGMPHGCDWPAPRRVSSGRRIAIVASATRLDSTLSQELPHALARVMAHATRLNARLASRKCDRPRSRQVHRLLKKHCDECGTCDAWQARLVMTQL